MATVLVEAPPAPDLPLHRISLEVYEQMVERGVFTPNDKIELLDGLLVDKMTKGAPHVTTMLQGMAALQAAAPIGWHIRPESPVALRGGPRGDSAPEPDLMVVFGDIQHYKNRHPTGDEIGLVIEIAADAQALRRDRAGLARYAHANIPIACIINLPDGSIEVHREPSGPTEAPVYGISEVLRPGQSLAGSIGTPTTGPAVLAPIPVGAFFDSL